MSDQTFPAFNFPFTSSVDVRQSLCDYGRTDLLAIFKDENGTATYIPQTKKHKSNRGVKLQARKPSLPLKLPNKICRKFSFDGEVDKRHPSCNVLYNYKHRNMQTFNIAEYKELLFGTFSSLFRKDAKELPPIPTRDKERRKKLVDMFDEIFCEIPVNLLDDLLEESYTEDMFTFNGGYYSNCLNYQYIGDSTTDIILTYPAGTLMDKLNLSLGSFSNDGFELSMTPESEAYHFPDKIYQISSVNELGVNPLVAVRTKYSCTMFCCEYNQDDENAHMKVLGNVPCKTRPCSVLVNPYIPGEVAIAMETGSVHLWHEKSSSLELAKKSSACSQDEFNWYFCEFGTHPRQIVRGSKSMVELVDFRTSSSRDKELLTLPSPHFFKDGQLSTVQRHPENPYQYFVGSQQFLVVLDERFAQTPVLKWCHSFVGPVKHINVVPDAFPGSKDTLVVVGDHKNHEVHCYQYCYGGQIPDGQTVMGTIGGLPPCPTSNPWKISPYTEWPGMVDNPNKLELMPMIKKKLDVPLISLTSIRHKENVSILQLSKEGDLFYQTFEPVTTTLLEERDEGGVFYYEEKESSDIGGKKPIIPESDNKVVKNWLQDIRQDLNESYFLDVKESELAYLDASDIREECRQNSNFPSQCTLCGPHISKAEHDILELCSHCSLDPNVSERLASVWTISKPVVVTNSYLGTTFEYKELKIFDESREYTDPLGVVLLKNWQSKEQTPIDLTSLGDESMMDNQMTDLLPPNDGNERESPVNQHKTVKGSQEINDGKGINKRDKKNKKASRVAGF